MSKKDVVVSVNNVSKTFKLPYEKVQSVKSFFVNPFKSRRAVKKGAYQALKDVSFEVKKGEFFGIVGRNGSGKSTMLKIIAGIYQPTEGSVDVDGRLVPFIELGVGFNPELTGRDNVYLNGAMMGFSEKEVDKKYEKIVEFAELEDFMDQILRNYSSGMQVRLAFSVATILAESDILLIDEVLAVGDADFQRKCFGYFRKLKREKKTVIFVSHDMSSVQEYCDRVLLIDKSKVKMIDKAAIVASEYSKLFMKKDKKKEIERKNLKQNLGPSGEERWGDEQAMFTKISADVSKDMNTIIIRATARANENIERPIFGFSIKNQLLEQLIGTNTNRKNLRPKPFKKGEERDIVWRVPNIFNQGEFYVDCTIAHDDAISVSDRWPEAASFQVIRVENNPYKVYSPDINFKEN